MQQNSLSVSIVIPVYNEAQELAACLDAVARQSVAPYEVVVVDNNSTDDSTAIARSYDFVKLVREPKQGVVYARSTGFNAATGEIIARIDADTTVPTDWVSTVQSLFEDVTLDAVSGSAEYTNVACSTFFNGVDLFFRRRLERQLKNRVYLWGSNMAMRRSAWQQVEPVLCNRAGIHEDFDIAIHLQELGGRVAFAQELQAQVSSRRIDVDFVSFIKYALVSPNTYAQHRIKQRIYMYEVVAVCILGYVPARLLHRGYDPVRQQFSVTQLLFCRPTSVARPDPTVHVA
ncbi:MAG: glycosyltransferase family 2 protein [Patescibacteria group bacterium]|nr:glycosyltransferase family 2 protein [Patescibacteria group bacterium]